MSLNGITPANEGIMPCAVYSDTEEPRQMRPGRRRATLPTLSPLQQNGDHPRTRARQPQHLTGTIEERYVRTASVLGEGMSGLVRMAVQKETNQRVAVKTYNREDLSWKRQADMCREMKIHCELDHPHIAKVLDVFLSRNHGHLVTEYLEGGDVMEQVIQNTRLHEREALLVVRQVLQALEHMHGKGYVHRDLKPENIVYEGDTRVKVKLIDFGFCCKWKEGQEAMSRCCGTDHYMAPEVRQGCYTSKCDIWSLGAALHVMLTGEHIGRAADGSPVMSKYLRRCSIGAQDMTEALLNLDPALRPTASDALRFDWIQKGCRLQAEKFPSDQTNSGASTAVCSCGGESLSSDSGLELVHQKASGRVRLPQRGGEEALHPDQGRAETPRLLSKLKVWSLRPWAALRGPKETPCVDFDSLASREQ